MDPLQLDEKHIEGRGLRKPYGHITIPPEGGIRVRCDDEIKEDFWLEVWITDEMLDRIVAERKSRT